MSIITIKVKYDTMTVHEGKLPHARLVWRASGLDVCVLGSIAKDLLFEQASHLALIECQNRHIPLISLRYQKGTRNEHQTGKKLDTFTKPLF